MPEPIVLDDGNLEFVVRCKDGSETRHSLDLLMLKLMCEECEDASGLQASGGTVRPTSEFLGRLCTALQPCIPNCTPSIAWQLWIAVGERMTQLKKSTSETPT